jgi:hypothetical protein
MDEWPQDIEKALRRLLNDPNPRVRLDAIRAYRAADEDCAMTELEREEALNRAIHHVLGE